ncbi:metallophosphoesterase [Candidatus Pacearchaeota archaeon]|nr:metallophosphoesterase [Candidatus Pacearchaeota archaeon]
MNKVAIIGDVHGKINEFRKLLDKLPADIDQVYTVGDIIDRGEGVKEVVQECIDREIISVRGNHEDMFLDYISNTKKYDKAVFELNGGMETLASYIEGVPDSHVDYFINMPYYVETTDFILSHAGVSSYIEETFRDNSDESNMELMWHRGKKSESLGKFQVFGHNTIKYVKIAWKGKSNPIHVNVDSGCSDRGLLTAIILPSRELIQARHT